MKYAHFVYSCKIESTGEVLVHVAHSGAILEMNCTEHQEYLKNKNTSSFPTSTFDDYLATGLVIEDAFSERDYFEQVFNKSRYSRKDVTVIPTMQCNFRCTYCNQNGVVGNDYSYVMDKDLIDKIAAMYSTDGGPTSLTFYGGEPLLVPDIVLDILDKCKFNVDKRLSKKFRSALITNGYLLNEDIAKKLADNGLSSVQITLDGTKEIHDSRRMLINGKGTYDTIIQNVHIAAKYIPTIYIRVNIEHETANISRDIANKEFGQYSNVRIYQRPTIHYTGKNRKERTEKNYKSIRNENELSNDKPSMDSLHLLRSGMLVCTASAIDGMTVMPNGDVYKCWHEIRTGKPVANIKTGMTNSMVNQQWVNWSHTSNKDCNRCIYLPVCGQRCPAHDVLGEQVPPNCIDVVKNRHARDLEYYGNQIKEKLCE